MTTDYFCIILRNKTYRFVRTESCCFDIAGCRVLTDGYINENDELILKARPVSDSYVAELVAKAHRSGSKCRTSRIRRRQKEEAV